MRNTGGGIAQALDMLATFASVGVQDFDITHTNIDEEKRGFRPKQSLQDARASMPFLIPSSSRRQNNVIIRPRPPSAVLLIQLDDVKDAALERIQHAAFMIVATSPGNYQGWLAVTGDIADRKDFARRVRKAAGADPSASGATRIAGTANYKRKYAPDFPTVQITASQPGRIVTAPELEALGLVAASEPARLLPPRESSGRAGKWPSYKLCLDRAPAAHGSDRPDVSKADFTWCMTAIDWGWPVKETAARLLDESSKARENGEGYALQTAENAGAAVQRRRGHVQATPPEIAP